MIQKAAFFCRRRYCCCCCYLCSFPNWLNSLAIFGSSDFELMHYNTPSFFFFQLNRTNSSLLYDDALGMLGMSSSSSK